MSRLLPTLACCAALTLPWSALAAGWTPEASERLIRLPAAPMVKAIERDFAASELAADLSRTNDDIGAKAKSVDELSRASAKAHGDSALELRHQTLASKRDYVELLGHRQELRREQLGTRMKLYERILQKMNSTSGPASPEQIRLAANQKAARERMERTISTVDVRLLDLTVADESRYGREYAKNRAAIEKLVAAVESHPMNKQATGSDGQPVDKKDFLRGLIADTQAELAILDQEETILAYMAKLVALDAMGLADEMDAAAPVSTGAGGTAQPDANMGITANVDLFVRH